MSLFLHLLILLHIAVPATILAAPVSIVQDGNLISELGNLFGDALRALSGDKPEPAAPAAAMQFFDAAQQKQPPREADRKEHEARTTALFEAIQSWVTQTCHLDEMQQVQVKELSAQKLIAETERFAKNGARERQERPFGETTPILFVQPSDGGTEIGLMQFNLINGIRNEVLTLSQTELLTAALAEREKHLRKAFREYIVGLVDQELFLTEEQREKLLDLLVASKRSINSPFYAFNAQPHYLPYKPIEDVLKARKADFLDEQQQKRLQDLTANNGNGNQGYIIFQASEGTEQWAETVKNAVVRQRELYLHATAVRIAYLERSLKLAPEQVAYLTVAGKGATTDALSDWKESTQNTIDQMKEQMGQMQGNFAFSAQNISLDGIDTNEIWTTALRETGADKQSLDRKDTMRRARAGCVAAMLDQELWLMPQQRTAVLEFTEAAMPGNNNSSPWDQYVRELLLLAYPLHKVPEAKVHEALSTTQQAIWKQLKDFFRWNKDNNYVEIPLKNQGGSFQIQLDD